MREYKYRAWYKELKKIIVVQHIDFILETVVFVDTDNMDLAVANSKDIELMQFTGGYDDNKAEIYIGDIIFSENEDGFCIFLAEYGEYEKMPETIFGAYYLKPLKHFDFLYEKEEWSENDKTTTEFVNKYNPDHKSFVIIGNKYENPELLEEIK